MQSFGKSTKWEEEELNKMFYFFCLLFHNKWIFFKEN